MFSLFFAFFISLRNLKKEDCNFRGLKLKDGKKIRLPPLRCLSTTLLVISACESLTTTHTHTHTWAPSSSPLFFLYHSYCVPVCVSVVFLIRKKRRKRNTFSQVFFFRSFPPFNFLWDDCAHFASSFSSSCPSTTAANTHTHTHRRRRRKTRIIIIKSKKKKKKKKKPTTTCVCVCARPGHDYTMKATR